MDKPTLLLNPGTGWSATTPMWLTLQRDNRYSHCGHKKEPLWLAQVHNPDDPFLIKDMLGKYVDENVQYWGFDIDDKGNWYRDRVYHDIQFFGIYPEWHDNPYGELCEDTREWSSYQTQIRYTDKTYHYTKEYLQWLFEYPMTIDKYIDYYTRHWNFIKDAGYHAVADFSNFNINLPKSFYEKYKKKLTDAFNIKVLIEFRDPIRRLFSELGGVLQLREAPTPMNCEITDLWNKHSSMDGTKQHNEYFIQMCCKYNIPNFGMGDYIKNYRKFADIFGQEHVYCVIMEELWNDRLDVPVKKLSKFLNFKIEKLHRNCYYPDLGNKAIQHEELQDQWSSDLETLEQSTVDKVMPHFAPIYYSWRKEFGTIPTTWNNPYV